MNLLLLSADELSSGRVHLTDARATHVREVLRAAPGDRLRVGIIDGPLGTARVLSSTDHGITLACEFAAAGQTAAEEMAPAGDTLLLACPFPQALRRPCLSRHKPHILSRLLARRAAFVETHAP